MTQYVLKSFISPYKDCNNRSRVRLGANDPVAIALPQGIVCSVEHVQEHWTDVDSSIVKIHVLLQSIRKSLAFPYLQDIQVSILDSDIRDRASAFGGIVQTKEEGRIAYMKSVTTSPNTESCNEKC